MGRGLIERVRTERDERGFKGRFLAGSRRAAPEEYLGVTLGLRGRLGHETKHYVWVEAQPQPALSLSKERGPMPYRGSS